ncbi:hypothetical protein SNE40_009371 [Patella caerulea]|uniref:Thyroglobulin type-1 domain-containing protein n=1 Tax=Patella caerulea TaxID=87958 RepID=A0AAN8JYX8_PATCE
MVILKFVLLATFVAICTSNPLIQTECPKNICLALMCVPDDPICKGGKIVPGAGYCGCCAACVRPQEDSKVGKCVEKNNNGLIGAQTFKCKPDGSFAPVRCQGSVCYCVDDEGTQLPGYSQTIGQTASMDCRCARDEKNYSKTGLLGKMFNCQDNGNYSPYKCVGSVCFCTDENGLIKGSKMVNIGELSSLQCTQ